MNLTASLFENPRPVTTSFITARLMKSVAPGALIHTASGPIYRVLGKTSSTSGIRLCIASNGSGRWINASQLADLRPLGPTIRRVAGLVHRVLAYDSSLSSYVDAAVQQAGLPKDPRMNWGRWLTAKYGPVLRKFTKDESLIDDAIREVIVHQLYELRLLDSHSPFAHFNPDHRSLEGKDLAQKVSAFLTMTFTHAVKEAVDYVKRALGVGAQGELGRVPTQGLYKVKDSGDEEGTYDDGEVLSTEFDRGESSEDSRLDEEEVHQFLEAFQAWYEPKVRENTLKVLNLITGLVEEGYSRPEIRDALVESDLKGRDGQPYSNDTFKVIMANWAKLMKQFASSEENTFDQTAISQAIADRAAPAKAAGLKLAQDDTGVLPQLPYSNNTPTVTVIDQPPQSPNVSQQEESLAGKSQTQTQDTSPQVSQQNTGEEDTQQPKRTIAPEIPGVNHV